MNVTFETLSAALQVEHNGHTWFSVSGGPFGLFRKGAPAVRAVIEQMLPASSLNAIAVSTAVVVTLGGLGWLIHRRNLLAGTDEVSGDWVKSVGEWLTSTMRQLLKLCLSRVGKRSIGDGSYVAKPRVALGDDGERLALSLTLDA